ncbi:MAG TPA: DUF6252 family protein [Bacteroidales bacterium]|nr:hypothetical protein [Bacteroidales bacterium]HOX78390.1 DUF6252 family protein [Bacteroidales bacterium]HPI85542.1 DUF6252 family protein [Bacteroidales bacterium]HPM91811.1 DUF6252 family protein [Bacteroidales bacterium]
MKKMRLFTFLIIALSIALVSCDKDNDGNNNGMGGTMTLKHDGSNWSASLAVAAANTNGVLSVTGSDNSANQCNVTLYNIPGPGTYQLGGSMSNPNTGRWTQGLGQNDTYSTMVGQGTGTCTITELTASKVSGTFEFTAKNTAGNMVTISEGSFSADL